jgi:para-nitrobenzyl esterase
MVGTILLSMMLAEGPRVKVTGGTIEGTVDAATGVRMFKGVPFAAPPVGDLRWREPQSVVPWKGVRPADAFGPRPMQLPIYSDMVFRSPRIDEDCLYLNIWAPPATQGKRLPVLVYFYGGGFAAGASDEPRYDGAAMARKGVIAVTVNYRLGIFGFFAHPELTEESPHHASGNYGLLDQSAAIQWVRKNIGAFGGDPKKITIGGESAGSFSVSAQMASPLSRGVIAGAIGESGAMLGSTLAAVPLRDAEQNGTRFANSIGAPTLSALRAIPAQRLLDLTKSGGRFGLVIDGYFLPKSALDIYSAGEQAKVPLLAGWNADESGAGGVLGQSPATLAGYTEALRRLYPSRYEDALKAYPAATDADVRQAATDLAGDRFIGFGTWKWTDLHGRTSGKPVYRYFYAQPRPGQGAVHSAEIEYALGNLPLNSVFAWTDADRKLSDLMQEYWANFVKKGDPNGPGLPVWPTVNGESPSVMRLAAESRAEPDRTQARYRFLDSLNGPAR